jgi:hypothetical protein
MTRKWKTEPLEKFADVISPEEYHRGKVRRHLPPVLPYRQYERTAELEMRREVEDLFRVKQSK